MLTHNCIFIYTVSFKHGHLEKYVVALHFTQGILGILSLPGADD